MMQFGWRLELKLAILSAVLLSLSIDPAAARQYQILHDFQFPSQDLGGGLVADGSGILYGMSSPTSPFAPGTVYCLKSDGTGFSVLHSFFGGSAGFRPNGALVLDASGHLYGTTEASVFSLKTDGSEFTVLHSFAGGPTDGRNAQAQLTLDNSSNLFGTTENGGTLDGGTIFRIKTDGTTFAIMHSFSGAPTDGLNPQVGLLWDGGTRLYGTTNLGGVSDSGTIFATTTSGSEFAVLHSFDVLANGQRSGPSSLIMDFSGNLYGTTYFGGAANLGIVFSMNRNGTAFSVLHSFAGSPSDGANPSASLLLDSAGNLYGTTVNGGSIPLGSDFGTVFRMALDGSAYSVLHMFKRSDGSLPYAPLILDSSGHLFGTTFLGGLDSYGDTLGVVFSLGTDGSDFKLLHMCPLYAPEGAGPNGSLFQDASGVLYGSTTEGGPYNRGALFRIDPDGSSFNVIHIFTGPDGDSPVGSLVMDNSGYLYGVTYNGGSGRPTNSGAIFKTRSDGKEFSVIHSFGNTYPVSAEDPRAGLVLDDAGTLYGTSYSGGKFGSGTVFAIKTDGTGFTVLHSFTNTDPDGGYPQGSLVLDSAGNLFGTTPRTVFAIRTDGTGYRTIHSFSGVDGEVLYGGVTLDGAGNLYGTASAGGAFGGGTIFRMRTDGSEFEVLHEFNGSTDGGISPWSSLLLDKSGNLYGTTREGLSNLFTIKTSGDGFTVVHDFGGPPDGELATSAVILDSFGTLYGVAPLGGSGGGGVIFKFTRITIDAVPNPTPEPIPGGRGIRGMRQAG